MKRLIILAILVIVLLPQKHEGLSRWYDYNVPNNQTLRSGAGSALTYGHNPYEPYGKLFMLVCCDGAYHFYWTFALRDTSNPYYLPWQELPAPDPEVAPQPDGAICYFYDPKTVEEKVVAVFGGGLDVWCYDVPTRTWRKEGKIPGTTPMDSGGSMEFWGFRRISVFHVATFYLIKGGGYPSGLEFWRYNRGPMSQPPRGASSYPEWERLKPFNYPSSDLFDRGADLAVHHTDTISDTIFVMRGWGQPFNLYRIEQDEWGYPYLDDILPDGAFLGGALASHPQWGIIGDEPGDTLTDENVSILHCFRGCNDDGEPTREFDCYDPDPSQGTWNGAPDNPHFPVSAGSDLIYGTCWYFYPSSSTIDSMNGLWASLGNDNWWIGFYAYDTFPSSTSGPGGGQSLASFDIEERDVIVSPNPAKGKITFSLLKSKPEVYIKIYSTNGEIIEHLKLNENNCVWDLKNKDGVKIPAGIYFYTVYTGNKEISGKLVINR